jgi:hypothetical protein
VMVGCDPWFGVTPPFRTTSIFGSPSDIKMCDFEGKFFLFFIILQNRPTNIP